jgi:hypothetical protein
MATLGIESNGRIEKTAVYLNGERIRGLKELFLNLDENGTFDAIIQYEGSDKSLYTKQLFSDVLNNIMTAEPAFTEEEAMNLQLLEIESNGDIENTSIFKNQEPLDGIVSLLLHIKAAESQKSGLKSIFSSKKQITDGPEFKAQITFRNDDDSLDTEDIF